MRFGRLNHAGVATPSIERSRERYARLFGEAAVGDAFDLPEQGVRVCFVDAPNTPSFNTALDWRAAPHAPLAEGVSQSGIDTTFALPKFGPGDF